MTNLKNQYSSTTNAIDKIQKILSENGARKVMFDYGQNGQLVAIAFQIVLEGKEVSFRLPAMIENVVEILYGGKNKWGATKKVTEAQKEQGYRTAWANIRDWLDAQMALVKTKQVELPQIFLPYMITRSGQTLYEHIIDDPKFLLGDGN